MKKIGYIILSILLMTIWSCNEDKWLTEEPLSIYAPENSYSTTVQFNQALNYLYDQLRRHHWVYSDNNTMLYMGDLAYGGTDYPDMKFNNMNAFITSNTSAPRDFWTRAYRSIANANTIINRVASADAVNASEKATIEGGALFFRAHWYNFLANLYGGVPLVLEEASTPRRDYVRATRQEVYDQARVDLEKAITLLEDIDDVKDGQISKQAAEHLLTEVYLSLENYTAAISTATAVISHPSMGLMTTRFGTSALQPGDPYRDLFQVNNQNRSTSGNKESILVLQYDYQNAGSTYSLDHRRQGLPYYFGLTVISKTGTQVLGFTSWTENKGGRGIGVYHPTDYFLEDIWGSDGTNDYRNSPYIILRDCKIDNPAAAGYGQWIIADGWLQDKFKLRHFYPFLLKFARTSNLPDDCYAKNADGSIKTTALGEKITAYPGDGSNGSLRDEYLYRLAGTYLLRAEAYVRNNQPDLALADINALRVRSNATPAQLSDIDLDYILDEQMRELYFEDFRLPTLLRLGKLIERGRAYNPMGYNIGDHQNLFPIPYSEIERNILSVIEQNPGY